MLGHSTAIRTAATPEVEYTPATPEYSPISPKKGTKIIAKPHQKHPLSKRRRLSTESANCHGEDEEGRRRGIERTGNAGRHVACSAMWSVRRRTKRPRGYRARQPLLVATMTARPSSNIKWGLCTHKAVNTVAPNVLPDANSQRPARYWVPPPLRWDEP